MYLLSMETALAPITAPARMDTNPSAVYLGRLAPGSRRTMGQALRVVADLLSNGRATLESFPWPGLRYQHGAALRSHLEAQYAPASANKILAAFRGVLAEAFNLGLVGAEDFTRAQAVKGIKGQAAPTGRALKMGEMVALFEACDATTAQGSRDAALLALLFGAGLRRAEACALDFSDYNPADGCLTVRKGKGAKARTVYARNGAAEALGAWLDVRGEAPGALLLAVDKAGNVRAGKGITGSAVFATLRRLQGAAGIRALSPHDARRTYITSLLGAGASITVVQKLAGHASVSTTARYDRSGEDAKRAAAEMLHVPFGG
jgi:site-specific recombinase XerD